MNANQLFYIIADRLDAEIEEKLETAIVIHTKDQGMVVSTGICRTKMPTMVCDNTMLVVPSTNHTTYIPVDSITRIEIG